MEISVDNRIVNWDREINDILVIENLFLIQDIISLSKKWIE